MIIQYRLWVCLGLFIMLTSNHILARPSPEKVLYLKNLSKGYELVVIQGPMMPASAMADLLPADVVDRTSAFFSLSVEFRSPSNPPLRLWSQTYSLQRDSQYDEFQVLDLLVLPNRIILAMATSGSSIHMNEIITHGGPSRSIGLRSAEWSLLGAMIPAPPGRLSAKLTYDDKEKCIEVKVTDFLQDTKQHTVFEQKDDQWEFVRVRQWQEKISRED